MTDICFRMYNSKSCQKNKYSNKVQIAENSSNKLFLLCYSLPLQIST